MIDKTFLHEKKFVIQRCESTKKFYFVVLNEKLMFLENFKSIKSRSL